MSKCVAKNCDNETVEPRPASGGSVDAAQMYCAVHLEDVNWPTVQAPLPVTPPTD